MQELLTKYRFTVLSSPVIATSPVEIVSNTSPQIKREESLENLVAKEVSAPFQIYHRRALMLWSFIPVL
jgi:hypothetical protein